MVLRSIYPVEDGSGLLRWLAFALSEAAVVHIDDDGSAAIHGGDDAVLSYNSTRIFTYRRPR